MTILNITALRDIERRLAEAKGADRDLDYAIAKALGIRSADDADEAERQIHEDKRELEKFKDDSVVRRICLNTFVVRYTKSLDAAVALAERVLPGWRKQMFELRPNEWVARVISNKTSDLYSNDGAPLASPGLALCLAIVSALIAKEEAGL